MLDELPCPARAIAEDDVAVDFRNRAIDEDEGNAELGESPQLRGRAVAYRRNHYSLGSVCDQLVDDVALDVQVCSGIAEDHLVVGSARDLLGCAHDRGEEGIGDVRDDHGECARSLSAEAAGEAARHVPELRDRLLDASPRLGADAFAVVDHPRDGHRRDPRQAGDVSDCGVAWAHIWYR